MRARNLLDVIELIGSPESVSLARDYVRHKLGAGHPALHDVTLLTSECVTNAVVHSSSRQGGKITLAIADCPGFIYVEVVDAGGETVPRVHDDLFAEGGRGLLLVETISHRWGVHEDQAGRAVWFEIACEKPVLGESPSFPRQREPPEPSEGIHESALRRAARVAAEAVIDDADRRPGRADA